MFLNLFLTPFLATTFFIVALYPLAQKIGLLDMPSHRKRHDRATPLIGGIAIYCSLWITLFFYEGDLPNQTAFIFAATLLVYVGVIDDYKEVNVKARLAFQIAAALIMVQFADIRITNLGNLLGFGNIYLGVYTSTLFTVFAVVGGINAFNMIDGLDGLGGSISLVSLASIAILSGIAQDWMLFDYCIIFIASLVAFLLFNVRIFGRPHAKIFLGDAGSTLMGFTVCWLLIDASQGGKSLIPSTAVLWIIGLPLLDSIYTILRRINEGKSPFTPDGGHLHHFFQRIGYSINKTLAVMVLFAFGLSAVGLSGVYSGIPETLLFVAFITLFAAYYQLMNKSWKAVKLSRHIVDANTQGRRIKNQTVEVERRSLSDRRYKPDQNELEELYKGNSPKNVSRWKSSKSKREKTSMKKIKKTLVNR